MVSERDAGKDLAICEKATWGNWYPGFGDIDSIVYFVHTKNGENISGDICTVDGGCNHKNDAHFIALAREALPYWIHRAREAEAVLNDIYPTLAGHLVGKRQLGEEKAAAEWERVVRQVYEVIEGVAK